MKSTLNFEEWLTAADLDGHEEIFSLYQTVWNDVENDIQFSCESISNGWLVTSTNTPLKLILATEKAKKAFLSAIEDRFCEGLDIDSWYGFEHAMSKND